MPRLRAVWSVTQALLALATIGWGLSLLAVTHVTPWAAGNLAAGVFFIVTIFLFAANHDDGRIVGAFGLAVFLVTNIVLIVTLMGAPVACEGAPGVCPDPAFLPPQGIPELEMAEDWTRAQIAFLFAGITLIVAVPQSMLLFFGHGTPRWAREELGETPPPM